MCADSSKIDRGEIAAREKLRESIGRLKGLQLTAEKDAGLTGMTEDESKQYRMRHQLITRLSEQLSHLEDGNGRGLRGRQGDGF